MPLKQGKRDISPYKHGLSDGDFLVPPYGKKVMLIVSFAPIESRAYGP